MKRIVGTHALGAAFYAGLGMFTGLGLASGADHALLSGPVSPELAGWIAMALYAALFRLASSEDAGHGVADALSAHLGAVLLAVGLLAAALRASWGRPFLAVGSVLAALRLLVFAVDAWRCDRGSSRVSP